MENVQKLQNSQNCEKKANPYATSSHGQNGWNCSEHRNCKTKSIVISCSWDGGHLWVTDPAHAIMFDIFERHYTTSVQERNQ